MFINKNYSFSKTKAIENAGVYFHRTISSISGWNWWIFCVPKGDGTSV